MFSKPVSELQEYKTHMVYSMSCAPKNSSRLERETFEVLKQLLLLIKSKFNLQEDVNTDYVHAQFTNFSYEKVELLFVNSSRDCNDDKVDKQNKAPIAFLKAYQPQIGKKTHPHVGWSYSVVTLASTQLVTIQNALKKLPILAEDHLEDDKHSFSKLF